MIDLRDLLGLEMLGLLRSGFSMLQLPACCMCCKAPLMGWQ